VLGPAEYKRASLVPSEWEMGNPFEQLDGGSLQSRSLIGMDNHFLTGLGMREDKENEEEQQDTSTGSSWSSLSALVENQLSLDGSPEDTLSQLSQRQPQPMSGSRILGLRELSSSMETEESEDRMPPIGTRLRQQQWRENLMISPQTYTFGIMHHSSALLRTIRDQLQSNVPPSYLLGVLELASREELGTRQESKLTLKILTRSGGTVTRVKLILSLMNFGKKNYDIEEESTQVICSSGQTDIRSVWKQKVQVCHSSQNDFGYAQTYPWR